MHLAELCVLTEAMLVDIASFLTWSHDLVPTWASLTYIQLLRSASSFSLNNWNELTQILVSYFFLSKKMVKTPSGI